MLYRLTADTVVLLHLTYLAFLIGGSLLAWRWPRLVWLHVPSLAWGLVSVTVGLECQERPAADPACLPDEGDVPNVGAAAEPSARLSSGLRG